MRLKEAPTQESSQTDPLSFRDLMWLAFLPNERVGDTNLLFESAHMRNLKLRQVVDVVFGVHDDRAVELGHRIDELERRLSRARQDYAAAVAFLGEQDVPDEARLQTDLDTARRRLTEADADAARLDEELRAATGFADELRSRHAAAAAAARRASALLRDHETLLRRMLPLRAQYAEDAAKLALLAEARTLFDPLHVRICPACLNQLPTPAAIDNGHCSLCRQPVPHIADHASPANTQASLPSPDARAGAPARPAEERGDTDAGGGKALPGDEEAPALDVAVELRATKGRLDEITGYIKGLEESLPALRGEARAAADREATTARSLDDATVGLATTPFLAARDDVAARRREAGSAVEAAKRGMRLRAGLDRRAADVARLDATLTAVRAELADATAGRTDRREILASISARFAVLLTEWKYPKLERPFIAADLTPHVRNLPYREASSGARTLLSIAWMLAVFETAWETGGAHPGFLMLDSPQKNLGRDPDRDFADSAIVDRLYRHLRDWLDRHGRGAQVIVVDNSPPAVASDNVVVRFSARADSPPYGLIDDETG